MLPAMTGSGDFNVTAAVAVVVGGIAAMLLATIVALGGYGLPENGAASVSGSETVPSTSAAGGALQETEVEYVPDTSEPTPTPEPHSP
jgi:hypothetical protein